jgi:opacity protein-like surface antigen
LTKGDKWKAGLDYERQDWTKAGFGETPGVAYKAQTAQSVRVGIEFVPNRYDIRYRYKRMTYRAGFHYDKSYVSLDGKSINQMGITLGTSIPVYRLNNSFNIAVDFGQRGSKTGNLVRENYINFILSISLHDLWFIKPKYQ